MVDFAQFSCFASVEVKLKYSAQEEEKMRLVTVRSTLYIDRSQTWKSVRCSSDPETGFLNVPQLYFQNSPILRINVRKESTSRILRSQFFLDLIEA